MTEPTYRQATPDDAEAIAAVGSTILEELGEGSGLPGPPTAENIAERLAGYGDRGAMFVCQSGGEVCGFAALEPEPEEGAAVMGVWLLPSARRHGVGRELALMALEFARNAGCRKVRGTLPQGNEAALSFFSEIGALAQVVGGGMQYELPL
ncbi:MAG: GNAT family N-acetyltransferase [Dehalococcoidia bacterium]